MSQPELWHIDRGAGLLVALLPLTMSARQALLTLWGVIVVAACIGAVGGASVQRNHPAHPH